MLVDFTPTLTYFGGPTEIETETEIEIEIKIETEIEIERAGTKKKFQVEHYEC